MITEVIKDPENGTATFEEISPVRALELIENTFLEGRQRPEREHVVRSYADSIRRNTFEPDTPIKLMRCRENGRTFLVDGQHRLKAVVLSGKPYRFTVIQSEVDTMDEVYRAYANTDRGQGRSTWDVARAYAMADRTGLQPSYTGRLISAAGIIFQDFKTLDSRGAPMDQRVDLALEWGGWAKLYFDAIVHKDKSLHALINAPAVAMGMVTMRYQQDKAWKFWDRVSRNSGLNKGEPEHTLANFLISQRGNLKQRDVLRAISQAWNAYMDDEELNVIRNTGNEGEIVLRGTPVGNGHVEVEAPKPAKSRKRKPIALHKNAAEDHDAEETPEGHHPNPEEEVQREAPVEIESREAEVAAVS